eukprot:1696561-Amphidinium_carterae.3
MRYGTGSTSSASQPVIGAYGKGTSRAPAFLARTCPSDQSIAARSAVAPAIGARPRTALTGSRATCLDRQDNWKHGGSCTLPFCRQGLGSALWACLLTDCVPAHYMVVWMYYGDVHLKFMGALVGAGKAESQSKREPVRSQPYAETSSALACASSSGQGVGRHLLRSHPLLCLPGIDVLHSSNRRECVADCLAHLSCLMGEHDLAWHFNLVRQLTQSASTAEEAVALFRAGTGVSVRVVKDVSELDWMRCVPEVYNVCVTQQFAALFCYTPVSGDQSNPSPTRDLTPTLAMSEVVRSDSSEASPLGAGVVQVTHVQGLSTNMTPADACSWWTLDAIEDGRFQVNLELKLSWTESPRDPSASSLPLVGGMLKRRRTADSSHEQQAVAVDSEHQWPRWCRSEGADADFELSVHLAGRPPVNVRVPDESRLNLEHIIADHLAVLHAWLEFQWRQVRLVVYKSMCSLRLVLHIIVLTAVLQSRIKWQSLWLDRDSDCIDRPLCMPELFPLDYGRPGRLDSQSCRRLTPLL